LTKNKFSYCNDLHQTALLTEIQKNFMEEKSISIDGVVIDFVLKHGEIQGYRKNIETTIQSKGGGSTVVPTIDGSWVSKNKELKIQSKTSTIVEFTVVHKDGTELPKRLVDEDVNFRDGQTALTIFEKETGKEIGILVAPLDHFILNSIIPDIINNNHPAFRRWSIDQPKLTEIDKRKSYANWIAIGSLVLFVISGIKGWGIVNTLIFFIGIGALVYKLFAGKGAKQVFKGKLLKEFSSIDWISPKAIAKITGRELQYEFQKHKSSTSR
jgi:hypothetical protein